jgi:hypothetical protein
LAFTSAHALSELPATPWNPMGHTDLFERARLRATNCLSTLTAPSPTKSLST